jgi:hypothetical protein
MQVWLPRSKGEKRLWQPFGRLRSRGTLLLIVYGFSALRAEKPYTEDRQVPLPQANQVSNAGDRVTQIIEW